MSAQDQSLILVAGATGTQGSATVRRLLSVGRNVRVLVRDPDSERSRAMAAAGAELVRADLDRPETLVPAVADVDAVFATSPASYTPAGGWDVDTEAARGRALVDAAEAAGVRHYVFSSIATIEGPGLEGSRGKRQIEQRLQEGGMGWTVLRPVRFMENYLARGLPIDGIHDGLHRHMFPADRPMQIVAVADIADFTGLIFADPDRFAGRVIELAGDDPTPVQAAETISRSIGRPITYQKIGRAEAERRGPEILRTWQAMEDGYCWTADIAALRALHPGLRTLDDWLVESGRAQLELLPANG